LPPFQGVGGGLFSYDLCHHFEVLPRPEFNDFSIPDMAVAFTMWIAFDHATDEAWLISTGYPEGRSASPCISGAAAQPSKCKHWLDRGGRAASLPWRPGRLAAYPTTRDAQFPVRWAV